MGRSPGFGSASRDSSLYSNSLSLRLPYTVNLATERNSLTHYAKGTRSPHKGAPTVCTHPVSGSISLPFRGSFRLSLTVLVHYRSATSIEPWRVVPPSSDRITRVPPYSSSVSWPFRVRDCHALWSAFPDRSTKTTIPYWALPRSLTATGGISVDFFSSRY